MIDPANNSEWITFGIDHVLNLAISWPFAAIVIVVILRSPILSAAGWLAKQAETRGIEARGPGGIAVRLDGPPRVDVLEADAVAASKLLVTAKDEDVRASLSRVQELSDDVERATAEASTVWSSKPLSSAESRAQRIAARARAYLNQMDDAERGAVGYKLRSGDDAEPVEFLSGPAERALLLVRGLKYLQFGLEGSDYPDYVRAAELMSEGGMSMEVPPFPLYIFRATERSRSRETLSAD